MPLSSTGSVLPPSASRSPSLARLESLAPRGMKLGLAAIDAVCERLGRPEQKVSSVLVAGTNGKGSTAAMLAAIARASGVRAGLYTSPHLIRVTERIRMEESDVSEEELDEALGQAFRAAEAAPEVPLTYFEALTAAAFLLFAQRRLDLSVLEVGLGGRFDATNVAPALLSVVTSIHYDHTEELGPTLSSVAQEKAGIFRRGRPALTRSTSSEATETLRSCAERAGAVWHDATGEVSVSECQVGIGGTRFRLTTPAGSFDLRSPLTGRHQAWNAALAIRSAELLSEESFRSFSRPSMERGLAAVRWPGRLETINAFGRRFLLDGCHNPEAAAALAEFLADAGLEGRCRLVFGAMADKDIEAMARILFGRVAGVSLVTAPSPRAATSAELVRRCGPFLPGAPAEGSLSDVIGRLLAQPEDAPIIVAGSLYLVGEARAWLLAEQRE